MIGNNEAYLIYNGKAYTKELFESKIKNHPKFNPSKAKFVGENPYNKKAQTPPPQARPQVAQTPPPQETPQEGALFEDAETQEIYNSMNSYNPDQIRDMAMDVETGVAPVEQPTKAPMENLDLEMQMGLGMIQDYQKAEPIKNIPQAIEEDSVDINKIKKIREDALKEFEKRLGKTDVTKITPESVARLEDQFAKNQNNLNLKNAPIVDGKIDVDNIYAKGSLSKAKQNMAISEKTGTLEEALFPETFEATRQDGTDGASFKKWMASVEDLTTLPGRAIIAAFNGSNSQSDFIQRLAVNSKEDTDSAELAKEAMNILNFIPGTKMPQWASKLAKSNKVFGTGALGRVSKKAGESIDDAVKFGVGVKGDIAENIATKGLPSYLLKAMGEYAPKPGTMKIPRAMVRQVIEDMPSVSQDALFRLTSDNQEANEVLIDFLLGTTVGGIMGRKKLDGSRTTDALGELRKIESPMSEKDLLNVKGIEAEGFSNENVKEALSIIEDALGEKSKDLDVLLKDFNIDVSEIIEKYKGGKVGVESLQNTKMQTLADAVESATDNGVISADKLREQISGLADIAFDANSQSNTVGSKSVKKMWMDLRNKIVDAMPADALKKDVSDYFEEMASLNQNILSPIKRGKGYEDGINKSIEGVLKKVRLQVVKGAPVSQTLTPLFALSREAKDIISKKFDREIAIEESIGKKAVLERRKSQAIGKFDFSGNELRTLRYLSDKYGDKIGLSKFLKKNKRSLIYDILSGLKPLVTRPIKAGAKGTRMNLTDVIDSIEEEYLQEDGDNRLGIIGSGIDATNEGIDSAKEAFDTSIDYGKQGIEGVKKLGFLTPKSKKKSEKLDAYKSSKEYKTLNKEQKKTTDDYFDYARSIGQTVKSDVVFKSPKPIIKQLMLGMNATYKELGITSQPAITSAEDADWKRPGYDRHEKGTALDYRLNDLDKATQKKLIKSVANKYKNNPNIDVEAHGKGQSYHLHIELDPK